MNEGAYNVSVSNSIDTASKTFSVIVKGIVLCMILSNLNDIFPGSIDKARIVNQLPSLNAVINETDELALRCIATGKPAPNITWTKHTPDVFAPPDPEPPSITLPSGYSITTTDPVQDNNGVYRVISTLLVASVMYTDRGTYMCTGYNDLLYDNSSALFSVSIQSRFH